MSGNYFPSINSHQDDLSASHNSSSSKSAHTYSMQLASEIGDPTLAWVQALPSPDLNCNVTSDDLINAPCSIIEDSADNHNVYDDTNTKQLQRNNELLLRNNTKQAAHFTSFGKHLQPGRENID